MLYRIKPDCILHTLHATSYLSPSAQAMLSFGNTLDHHPFSSPDSYSSFKTQLRFICSKRPSLKILLIPSLDWGSHLCAPVTIWSSLSIALTMKWIIPSSTFSQTCNMCNNCLFTLGLSPNTVSPKIQVPSLHSYCSHVEHHIQ